MIFENLDESVNEVTKRSREAMHHAATLAGMAFSNAFLGICHSMAHKLGQKFHIPHGLANAICLVPVMKYNSCEEPTKMGTFPQYKYPCALDRYCEISDFMHFTDYNASKQEKLDALCKKIYELEKSVQISACVKDFRNAPTKEAYFEALDYLSYHAFDDQCTSANPRYPLIPELKELFVQVWDNPM